MTATLDRIVRPDVEYSAETGHRKIGLGVGAIALMIGMVVVGLGIYAASLVGTAGEEETLGQVLAIAFGLNTTALVMLKAGIAIILVGILVRIWIRVDSVKASLAVLKPDVEVGSYRPVMSRRCLDRRPCRRRRLSVSRSTRWPTRCGHRCCSWASCSWWRGCSCRGSGPATLAPAPVSTRCVDAGTPVPR